MTTGPTHGETTSPAPTPISIVPTSPERLEVVLSTLVAMDAGIWISKSPSMLRPSRANRMANERMTRGMRRISLKPPPVALAMKPSRA